MRPSRAGQSLIVAAVATAVLVAMMSVVINVGALLLDARALNRAAESAALAALRPAVAGDSSVMENEARLRVETVLRQELENLRCLQTPIEAAAAGADISVMNPDADGCVHQNGTCFRGPVVRVRIAPVEICPPLWACVAVGAERTVVLETDTFAVPPATPVAEQIIGPIEP